ncbi:GNAT family N-acetyltransferase [Paraburkholderia hospita]|nr:GNAT family N-acetyltransferase [Paraburkholderia hospita]
MVTIRKAICRDVCDAWDIRRTSVHAACAQYYPEAALSEWVDGALTDKWASVVENDFYVVVDENIVVGTGMLTVANGQIDAIFVRPSHMGLGIGRKMLHFLEALAGAHGVVALRLDATLNAAAFYRRCGWAGDSISTYRSSRGLELACVPMTKHLTIGG